MNALPLLAYYGDDFTGSTDALEFLSKAGVKTVLFLEPPTPEQLALFPGIQAFGVAGTSRSMTPEAMEITLHSAFTALKQSGARHVHYKVCSTFDSSPSIGSIGKAIEIGAAILNAPFVPLLVAAPALGRYCVFGNLFARMGIGSNGAIYRLDRHPSMSKHPVTPANESDLRLHLSQQTSKSIGLVDLLQVNGSVEQMQEAVQEQVDAGSEVVLFDALFPEQLKKIGQVLDRYAQDQVLFSVGSSGIEMALGAYWNTAGKFTPLAAWPDPGAAHPLLVASGSCSPVTDAQISWALENGFAELPLDTTAIAIGGAAAASAVDRHIADAVNIMGEGRSLIIHTSRGPDDSRIKNTALKKQTLYATSNDELSNAEILGSALGKIIREVAQHISFNRLVIAGGDTSGFVGKSLGIEALEMIAPLTPGAPLCSIIAPNSPVHGKEVLFKGGQVGPIEYFGMAITGSTVHFSAAVP